jgi:type IV pilus assembly protein PilE
MSRAAPPRRPRAGRGFSLAECLVACAVVGLLACLALPSYREQQLRAGRLDAVDALTRLQVAQEQHRAAHGRYATQLQALVGTAAHSRQGLYTLALAANVANEYPSGGGEAYAAVATAQGSQSRDTACAALTLSVQHGFAEAGPSVRCWNR